MKVTSYELSKKLEEIGFKKPANYCWSKDKYGTLFISSFEAYDVDEGQYLLAYDLETLLEAIPDQIRGFFLQLNQNFICYDNGRFSMSGTWYSRSSDESLADVSARLLLSLVEKGILKFNK